MRNVPAWLSNAGRALTRLGANESGGNHLGDAHVHLTLQSLSR